MKSIRSDKMVIIENKNSNYELIDFEEGYKYERLNNVIVKRPDSNATGHLVDETITQQVIASYDGAAGEGKFHYNSEVPEQWTVDFEDLKFKIKLTSYKHIGIFPEQSHHWNLIKNKISNSTTDVKVLNLFAYTGAATINAAKAGAKEVVHVEALKQLNNWAKENSELSKTDHLNIRYMNDDVITFLKREVKRENKYQIIIMDPPSFGRGPKNQIWKFQDNIDELLQLSSQLLENPICLMISTYTNNFSKNDLKQKLNKHFKNASVETYDMYLKSSTHKLLPCGTGGVCNF